MSEVTYVVKSGDTLGGIASRYNVAGGYMALANYNGIRNPNVISIGQKIKIPGTSTTSASSSPSPSPSSSTSETVYVVQSGDTLDGIASAFHVAGGYQALAAYNGISNPNRLSIGQKIKIPGTSSSSGSSSPAPAPSTSSSSGSISVGSRVKITGSRYATGQSIPNWVKQNTYTVSQINGNKALMKEIQSWVYISDLQTEGSSSSAPAPAPTTDPTPETKPETPSAGGSTTPAPSPSTDAGASPLVTQSCNFGTKNSNARNQTISKITIHHMAGNMDAKNCAEMHKNADNASANYYIGSDGTICSGVAENRRAWTSSSPSNDHQAITMEVANNSGAPNWTVSDSAYSSMIRLCADICSRYGISPEFTGNASGSLTAHYMFSSTLCPGPYLTGRLKDGTIARDIKAGVPSAGGGNPGSNGGGSNGGSGSGSAPAADTIYTVRSGDTLGAIASRFGVAGGYQALAAYNGISNPNVISVGQQIRIPGSGSTVTPAPSTTTGGGSSSPSTAGRPGYPETATWNIPTIYNYLVNECFSDHPYKKALACGFLGNIYTESHYQPDAEQVPGSKDSGGKGIVQWDDRKYNLYNFCGAQYSEKSKWQDLDKQLQFIKHELNGSEASACRAMREAATADTVEAARYTAYIIAKKYERCQVPSNPERQDKAEENFNNL